MELLLKLHSQDVFSCRVAKVVSQQEADQRQVETVPAHLVQIRAMSAPGKAFAKARPWCSVVLVWSCDDFDPALPRYSPTKTQPSEVSWEDAHAASYAYVSTEAAKVKRCCTGPFSPGSRILKCGSQRLYSGAGFGLLWLRTQTCGVSEPWTPDDVLFHVQSLTF